MSALDKAAKTERDPESCWQTPDWLMARIREALGGTIELDPCTTPENPTGAERFYTPDDDGILQPWDFARTIYVNPPYGRTIFHWVKKAVAAGMFGAQVILLVPARTDAAWWHYIAPKASILLFKGRIRFKGAGGSPKFPSALLGLNNDLSTLADLGVLLEHAA